MQSDPFISDNNSPFEYYRRLGKIKRHIETHYNKRITAKDAAKIVGLEYKYFSKYFKEKSGKNFRDWVAEVRVNKAIEMMSRKNYRVSEVAYAVGYSDIRTFERTFKRLMGKTPSDYKKDIEP